MISTFSWSQSVVLIPNKTKCMVCFFYLLILTKGSPHSIVRDLSETTGFQLESLKLQSKNGKAGISRHSLFPDEFPQGLGGRHGLRIGDGDNKRFKHSAK